MPKFIDVGYLGAKTVKDESNENGGPVFQKDDSGKMKYFVRFNDEVEVTVNGQKVNTLHFSSKITKMEQAISRAGKEGDEEKVEKLEKTKKRFEKDGDLSYIKFDGCAVFDD